MRSTVVTLIAVFLIAIAYVGNADAQGRMGKGNRFGMEKKAGFRGDFLTKLNLTDAQKDKIKALRDEHQKKMIDLRAQLQKDMLSLKEVKQNENASRKDILAAVENVNKSKEAISLSRTNHLLDVREVLTPEQRKSFKDLQEQMMRKHRKGMGRSGMGNGMHNGWK